MARIPVIVLYGGRSTEHEVSCHSASFVFRNLDPQKYDVTPVGISKNGTWYLQNLSEVFESGAKKVDIAERNPIQASELLATRKSAVYFPVTHGTFGEDGTLQGFLQLNEVAFVGADTLGSALAMDKIVAKKLVELAGVPIVPYVEARKHEWKSLSSQLLAQSAKELGWPVFVKPASLGSSIGIYRVEKDLAELQKACEQSFQYDDKILIEKGLKVREFECAILGDDITPKASVVGEIAMSKAVFYDYEAKYLSPDSAEVLVPAKIDNALSEKIRTYALTIFRTLELHGLARIDFFYVEATQSLYFNEANTLPGFTEISQYPMLWKASGMDAGRLVDRLIELALERKALKASLIRSR